MVGAGCGQEAGVSDAGPAVHQGGHPAAALPQALAAAPCCPGIHPCLPIPTARLFTAESRKSRDSLCITGAASKRLCPEW